MSNELALTEIEKLSPVELEAYNKYVDKGGAPLSPGVQAQLFSLYLHGDSCEDIADLNKNFSLGMIVKAKVDGLWEQKREVHLRELLDSVKDRVTQAQLESAIFATDLLAATHKIHSKRFKRAIQTGDEKELGDMAITSIKQYRDAVDLLLKVTGQDTKQQLTVKGEQTHRIEFSGKMTPQEAALALAAIEAKK
jgi:hypothetical protein